MQPTTHLSILWCYPSWAGLQASFAAASSRSPWSTRGRQLDSLSLRYTKGWAGPAKQTLSWGWVPTSSSTIKLRSSVKRRRQASQRSATSRILGQADLPTRLRTLGSTSSPGIDFSFRRQGACTLRSTSRSSIGLHPSCPPVGYFDSLSLQAVKVKTVALRGTASLQLQAFDLQTILNTAWQHPSIKHHSAAVRINQSTSTITNTEFIRCKAAGRIFLSGSLERFATSCQSRDISS